MCRKLQENQRKNSQIEIKTKNKKTNENQRKSVDEVEEQEENLKSVKSMKTEEKVWAIGVGIR